MTLSTKSGSSLPRGNACVRCRTRKVKCDAARPSCSACIQTGRSCEYSAPTISKSQLQSRVQELQDQLYELTVAQISSSADGLPRIGALTLEVQPLRPSALSTTSSMAYVLVDLRGWRPGSEMSLQLRSNLLQVFIRNQSQFNLDLYIPRLQEMAILPSSHPRALLPALTSALALVACSCFGDEVQSYENYFLQATRDQCHQALAVIDRLDQYFIAQLLVAHYFLRVGRLQEAYLSASTLLRFAVACELNEINDPRSYQNSHTGLLGPSSDIYQTAERINLWWSCYSLSRRIATVTGLSDGLTGFPDSITTVLPVSYAQVDQHGLDAWHPTYIKDIFTFDRAAEPDESDSRLRLVASSTAVVSQFHELYIDVANPKASAQMAITMSRISSVSLNVPGDANMTSDQWHSDPTFLNTQVDLYSVLLGLNQRESGELDELRSGNRLRAARGLAKLASAFRDSSRMYSHIPLVCPMLVASSVLIENLQCQAGKVPRPVVRDLQNDLFAIAEFLSELPGFFPQLPTYLTTLVPYMS